jgi:hypothetical protein
VYVEPPTKVDSFFPFFKKVHSFFWIFLNWIADFVLWTVVFLFFYRYSVLFECIHGFFFLWCKNVTIELFYSVRNILYVFNFVLNILSCLIFAICCLL